VPSFAGNQQQDAHEFTRFLLERLRSEFVRGDALAEKARRAASLSLSAGAKDPLRRHVTPRGREHGEEGGVMLELGIPNPIRRSRSLRAGQRTGGKWTDSPGSISPSGASGDASPGRARRGDAPRGGVPDGHRRGAHRGGDARRDARHGGRRGRVHDCLALGRGAAQARVPMPPLQVAAQGGGGRCRWGGRGRAARHPRGRGRVPGRRLAPRKGGGAPGGGDEPARGKARFFRRRTRRRFRVHSARIHDADRRALAPSRGA
jgi:hypothetical protein